MKVFDLGLNANGTRSKFFISDNEVILQDETPKEGLQAIIDHNARMRETAKRSRNGSTHVATIPADLHMQWRMDWRRNHSDKWSWKTYLAMKLNNKDWVKFRTSTGRI